MWSDFPLGSTWFTVNRSSHRNTSSSVTLSGPEKGPERPEGPESESNGTSRRCSNAIATACGRGTCREGIRRHNHDCAWRMLRPLPRACCR